MSVFLLQADGPGDLVMLGPPLAIEREQADEAVAILGDAIAVVTRVRPPRPASAS